MKRIGAMVLSALLALVGCADNSPRLSPAKKEALRAILDPTFVFTPALRKREDEVYRMLEAFAENRKADELVRSITFSSTAEAELLFTDRGMHGGGSATLTRKGARWTVEL